MSQNLIEVVRQAINEDDPLGLLRDGCPEDEYDPEVGMIAVKLTKNMTVGQISSLIFSVFSYMFAPIPVGGKNDYRDAAKKIHEALNK